MGDIHPLLLCSASCPSRGEPTSQTLSGVNAEYTAGFHPDPRMPEPAPDMPQLESHAATQAMSCLRIGHFQDRLQRLAYLRLSLRESDLLPPDRHRRPVPYFSRCAIVWPALVSRAAAPRSESRRRGLPAQSGDKSVGEVGQYPFGPSRWLARKTLDGDSQEFPRLAFLLASRVAL